MGRVFALELQEGAMKGKGTSDCDVRGERSGGEREHGNYWPRKLSIGRNGVWGIGVGLLRGVVLPVDRNGPRVQKRVNSSPFVTPTNRRLKPWEGNQARNQRTLRSWSAIAPRGRRNDNAAEMCAPKGGPVETISERKQRLGHSSGR